MKKTISIIIITIMAVIAAGIGLYFGGNAIYNTGVNDGRNAMSDEVSEKIRGLGIVVAEKEYFRNELESALSDTPAELNTEGIDGYIGKLNELIDKIELENVKDILRGYLDKWQTFKETYASENNDEISEKFNELKTTATDTAKDLKALYDNKVREAIERL